MPSTKTENFHVPRLGVDRSSQPFTLSAESFRTLTNLRPKNGELRQTPLFGLHTTLSTLAGVAPGQVRSIVPLLDLTNNIRYFVLDEASARLIDPLTLSTQVNVPFILQNKVPDDITINGQCLLYGISNLNFTALGNTIDIEATATSSFRWRQNGGAWTTLGVGPSVSLGTTGLKAGFLATTGYSTQVWQWTRSANPYQGLYPSFGVNTTTYLRDCYVAGLDRQVLRLRDNVLTSVGYKRVYGKYVAELYNHIVVAHFAEGIYDVVNGVVDSYDQSTTPWLIAWSDRDNPDNYFNTLINEADQFPVPSRSFTDVSAMGITGLAGFRNQLFLYLSDEIYSMSYVGLPNVMQIDCLKLQVGSIFQSGVIATPNGHYFITRNNICLFNGVQVLPIGDRVRDIFFGEIAPPNDPKRQWLFGVFDSEKSEVVWTYLSLLNTGVYQGRQMVYRIDADIFYFRNVPSAASAGHDIRAVAPRFNVWEQLVYGGNAEIYADDPTGGVTDLQDQVDAAGVQTYTQPSAETQDLVYDDVFHVKETDTLFLDAGWTTSTGLQVQANSRNYISFATLIYNTLAQLWTGTQPENVLSYPRMSGRVFRYLFSFQGTKPVGCVLRAWGDFVYGRSRDVEK